MRKIKLILIVLLSLSFLSLVLNDDIRISKIIEKFNRYNEKFPYQEIYIQTDKSSFEVGETVWIKAYIRRGSENKPDTFSTNLYIDFINWQNEIVASKLLKIKKGIAFGEYHLPDSMPEGKYMLRAFTNSMRNFENDYFFTKEIHIKNSNPKWFAIKSYQLLKPYLRKWERNSTKFDIQFMPEGGNLVAEIENIVAFKAINRQEKAVNISGILLDSKNKEVLNFKSTHLGMGKFQFIPKKGEKYKVKVSFDNEKSKNFDFPEVNEKGFVLKVDNSKDNFVNINVKANFPKTEDKAITDFFIVIQNSGKLIYSKKANIKSGEQNIKIENSKLRTGINQITLINGSLKPKCERLFYTKSNVEFNIELSGLKKDCKIREVVNFQLDIINSGSFKKYSNKSNLAISAVNYGEISNEEDLSLNIVNYFNLKSKLRGKIEQIEYYFSGKTIEVNENLDLLLLTQAWRRFDWTEIMKDSTKVKYKEDKLISVGGRLTRDLLDIPLKGIKVQMSILNKFNEGFTTFTNGKGEFLFENLNYSDTIEVLIEAEKHSGKKNLIIHLDIDSVLVKNYQLNPEISLEIFSTKGRKQKKVIYRDPNERVYEEGQAKDNSIHSSADQIIYMKDNNYSASSNLEDIIRQNVPGFSGRGNSATIRGISSLYGSNNPLLIVDGTATDYSVINSIPITDVERIEILKGSKAAIYGLRGGNGVIAVYTKRGRFAKRGEIQFNMLGYASARKFYSPKYKNNSKKEKPDLRKTIYWNPEIITDENGKAKVSFYNSDLKGKVIIRVEGIDENGNAIFSTTSYLVK